MSLQQIERQDHAQAVAEDDPLLEATARTLLIKLIPDAQNNAPQRTLEDILGSASCAGPNCVESLKNLGNLYFKKGQFIAAVKMYTQARASTVNPGGRMPSPSSTTDR